MSNMTQEQRDHRNEKRRERYANRTPEQQAKDRERQRAYRSTDAGREASNRAHAKWTRTHQAHVLAYNAEYYANRLKKMQGEKESTSDDT